MSSGIKKVFVTPLTAVDTVAKDGLGEIRREGNKTYKYVKYDDGTANLDVLAGDVVAYLDYDANSVTADMSDSNGIPAGVIVAAAITETDRYVWIQIKGAAALAVDVTGGAVNDDLTVGATDKAFIQQLFSGTSPNIEQNGPPAGTLYDATASNMKAILDCLM